MVTAKSVWRKHNLQLFNVVLCFALLYFTLSLIYLIVLIKKNKKFFFYLTLSGIIFCICVCVCCFRLIHSITFHFVQFSLEERKEKKNVFLAFIFTNDEHSNGCAWKSKSGNEITYYLPSSLLWAHLCYKRLSFNEINIHNKGEMAKRKRNKDKKERFNDESTLMRMSHIVRMNLIEV